MKEKVDCRQTIMSVVKEWWDGSSKTQGFQAVALDHDALSQLPIPPSTRAFASLSRSLLRRNGYDHEYNSRNRIMHLRT